MGEHPLVTSDQFMTAIGARKGSRKEWAARPYKISIWTLAQLEEKARPTPTYKIRDSKNVLLMFDFEDATILIFADPPTGEYLKGASAVRFPTDHPFYHILQGKS